MKAEPTEAEVNEASSLRIKAMEFACRSQIDMSRGISPSISDLIVHAEKIYKWLSEGK